MLWLVAVLVIQGKLPIAVVDRALPISDCRDAMVLGNNTRTAAQKDMMVFTCVNRTQFDAIEHGKMTADLRDGKLLDVKEQDEDTKL